MGRLEAWHWQQTNGVAKQIKTIKWQSFIEQISELCGGINILDVDLIQMLVLAYEMIYHVDVLCTIVKFRIVNKSNGALIVGEEVHCLTWLVT